MIVQHVAPDGTEVVRDLSSPSWTLTNPAAVFGAGALPPAVEVCVSCGGRVDPTVDHDPEGDRVLCEDCCGECSDG